MGGGGGGALVRKDTLAIYHNINYSINYYSLTKKGGGGVLTPWICPCSAY